MNKFVNSAMTLVELMVVVTIVVIISAIAFPTYQNYLISSRRHDAINAMRQLQTAVESYKEQNGVYPTSTDITIDTSSSGGFYTITYTRPSTTRYKITADANSGTSQASDTACVTMNLVPEMDDVYPTQCR